MPTVRLGNVAALDRGQVIDGNQITTIQILDDDPIESRLRTILHEDGLWPRMSAAPAQWVESDDLALATALANHFNCPIGRPGGWVADGEPLF